MLNQESNGGREELTRNPESVKFVQDLLSRRGGRELIKKKPQPKKPKPSKKQKS